MKRKTVVSYFVSLLIFFLTVAVISVVSILTFDKIDEVSNGNNGVIALVLFLVILFFTVLYALIDALRRRIMIVTPVEKILEATKKIAKGDFSVRLATFHPYGKYDEFDCIIENVNLLAEELGKSEILKTDFIANVSHELKTPLAIIQNYASSLQNGLLSETERKEYAKTVETAAKRLTKLVTNVLQLNKLEHSKLLPEKQWIRLDEHLTEAALVYEERLDDKGISLKADLEEISVFTSPELLSIVWSNLLSNAVKFTEQGGKISLSLCLKNGNAIVKISDTGEGIAPEMGKRIFDKFYQGDTSHAAEGNGLGLALVKKVIDILGGEISVESETGKGSTFTVTLKESAKSVA